MGRKFCYIFVEKYNIMPVSTIKEQTAFRFEPELLVRMKKAAKMRKKSLNQYVTEIIEKDLSNIIIFSKGNLF